MTSEKLTELMSIEAKRRRLQSLLDDVNNGFRVKIIAAAPGYELDAEECQQLRLLLVRRIKELEREIEEA